MQAVVEPDPFRDLAFDIRSIVQPPRDRKPAHPPSGRLPILVPRSAPPPPILEDEALDAWFR